MQLLGDSFSIVVFLTLTGAVYAFGLFICKRVFCFTLPLWMHAAGIIFFIVPIVVPGSMLIPPEATQWLPGYVAASLVWICGAAVALLVFSAIRVLSFLSMRSLVPCEDVRLRKLYQECVNVVGVPQAPRLLSGTLGEPAGVAAFFRPAIVVNEAMLHKLSDKELSVVLCHELVHVKRGHHLFKCALDACTTLHWFNPLMWLFRHDFLLSCEIDCDRFSRSALSGACSRSEYAKTLLHLEGQTYKRSMFARTTINALDYLIVKQRVSCIIQEPPLSQKRLALMFATVSLAATLALASSLSEGYFYPYAQSQGSEASAELADR